MISIRTEFSAGTSDEQEEAVSYQPSVFSKNRKEQLFWLRADGLSLLPACYSSLLTRHCLGWLDIP